MPTNGCEPSLLDNVQPKGCWAPVIHIHHRADRTGIFTDGPQSKAVEQHIFAADPNLAKAKAVEPSIQDLSVAVEQIGAQCVEFRLSIGRLSPKHRGRPCGRKCS